MDTMAELNAERTERNDRSNNRNPNNTVKLQCAAEDLRSP